MKTIEFVKPSLTYQRVSYKRREYMPDSFTERASLKSHGYLHERRFLGSLGAFLLVVGAWCYIGYRCGWFKG